MYPKTLAEAYTPIVVKPLTYKPNYFSIKGLPTTHFTWIVLKWMPVKKIFRVTRTPPYEGYMNSQFINAKERWHKDWDCATLEEATEIVRQLAAAPLFQPTI